MIKRRFYMLEHANANDASDSSSSSDSELEGQATEDSEDDAVAEVNEDDAVAEVNDESCSTSSGYEHEDSSADEINVESSDDTKIGNGEEISVDNQLSSKLDDEVTKSNTTTKKASVPAGVPDCVLQIKSVFRCRICPKILCLTEETLRAHLNSKRHARSEKLLKEHRLKAILNDDGEIENQETAGEMHARIVALAQSTKKTKNKNRRQHRKRNLSSKENTHENSIPKKAKHLTQSPAKKRRKGEN